MENHRKRSSSSEISSSSTPNQDNSDFEFGRITPDSPSQDPYRSSPADHLFLNGKLLPHAFPLQPATMVLAAADHGSRQTSRTTSINSKDSSMSSRSNSTNSRSSCSSARTSSSDNSDRKILYHKKFHSCNKASRMVSAQIYGDFQRWQYVTAVPVLKRDVSKRKNSGVAVKDALKAKKPGDHHHHHQERRSTTRGRSRPCLRIFRLFLLACRECHAMEPSRKQTRYEPRKN